MSTEPVSADQVANTRKTAARIQGEVLRRLAEVTQARVADCIGVDPSKISRSKDYLEDVCQMLAALGFQLAPRGAVVVDRQDQIALKRMAFNWLRVELEGGEK